MFLSVTAKNFAITQKHEQEKILKKHENFSNYYVLSWIYEKY